MSFRRTRLPLRRNSDSPVRKTRRLIVIRPSSEAGWSLSPLEVPRVRVTSPMERARRRAEPWKMTSSIVSPRMWEARFSPRTQMMASQIFDFPQPFGPTTAVIAAGKVSWAGS